MAKRKTANEKLRGSGVRELVDMPENWKRRYPPGKLLIPLPTDIRDEILTIPLGQTREMAEIRNALASKHGAVAACPLVSGISWRLVAEAAEEDRTSGASEIAPYWRVVKENGGLNEKLPGGLEGHAAALEAEGHSIVRSGRSNKPKLACFAK